MVIRDLESEIYRYGREARQLLAATPTASVLEVLDRAAGLLRRAIEAAPADHPSRAGNLSNLGTALRRRFEHTGEMPDLELAIDVCQQAVTIAGDEDPERPGYLSNLGAANWRRAEHTGDRIDLDQALDLSRQAVAACSADFSGRAMCLIRLGSALRTRYLQTDDLSDLDEAIDVSRLAATTVVAEDPDRTMILSNFGGALQTRFWRMGDLRDLDEAIDVTRQAVTIAQADHADRAVYLNNFGLALWTRFERIGNRSDVDEAVDVFRNAVAVTSTSHRYRAMYLSNFALVLLTRFERIGDLSDVDEAIGTCRESAATTPTGHPHRAAYLAHLATALQTRYQRAGNLSDLDEAAEIFRQAVTATPTDHPDHAGHLSNLGLALQARFEQGGDQSNLDEAVEISRQAVTATPTGHPDRAIYLSNLGLALRLRSEQGGDQPNFDEAVEVCRQAVTATPIDHPNRATYLSNLGIVLQARFRLSGDERDRQSASELWQESAGATSAAPLVRAQSAQRWAGSAAGSGDWHDAASAWDAVFVQIPLLVDQGLGRGDRQHHLSLLAGLGPEAAGVALHLGDVGWAWQRLEQGRGVLLGQVLENRSDDTGLAGQHPELAVELDRLRTTLSDASAAETPSTVGAERRRAVAEWDRLLTAIRDKPGFDRFGLPPTLDQLRAATADGAVVAVNVAEYRCDALILTSSGMDLVRLPDLTRREATARAGTFLATAHERSTARTADEMSAVLEWLWDTVASPVLQQLGHTGPPPDGDPWPRMWWIPTGPLSVMPIHAAGRRVGGASNVLDRVISSYTPTVRVLHHARNQPTRRAVIQPLVVGITDVPSASRPLAFARAEAIAVAATLNAVEPLLDENATYAAVMAGLNTATWAHFACHGTLSADPADSHLLLYDRPLPVRDLTNRDLSGGYLAYLSACVSAYGGISLPDESVHLASAFQLGGFQHVVATLWPISDAVAPNLAAHIYQQLANGSDPAGAVHHAVRAVRASYPDHPQLWASHVHFGP